MIRALIILPNTSRFTPAKVGDFLWNEEFQAHLWQGQALEMEEFNAISKRIFYERRDDIEMFDLPPYVQLVDVATEAPREEKPAPEKTVEKPAEKKAEKSRGEASKTVPKLPLILPDPKKL